MKYKEISIGLLGWSHDVENMTFGLALTNQSKRNIALFPPQTSTWLMRFLFRSSGRKVISDACRTNTFDQWRDKISLDVYSSALKYRLFFVRFYVTFTSFSSYMLLTMYVELMWKKQLLSSFLAYEIYATCEIYCQSFQSGNRYHPSCKIVERKRAQ